MRDIPLFTTEYGVSSLVLKEIPYKGQAYIHIRDVQEEGFSDHLKECVSFCRMAGAEEVFAAGHDSLERYPLYTAVWEMRGNSSLDATEALFPVTEATVSQWRKIYNERMRSVDNSGTLEARDEQRILNSGTYFVHREGTLLGIGWMEDNKLLAIAAVEPGAGETVARSLFSLATEECILLEVASTNHRAIRLYEKLGFVKTREISRWYRVL